MLAGARDPTFGRRAWRVRITRGVYLMIRRGVIPDQSLPTQFRAHVYSPWTNAVVLLCGIEASEPSDRAAPVEGRLRDGFDRLR
jgi:hypothetical protein